MCSTKTGIEPMQLDDDDDGNEETYIAAGLITAPNVLGQAL